MENYIAYYNKLVDKIRSARNTENLIILLTGFFGATVIGMAVLLFVVLIESIAMGDTKFRTVLFGIWAAVSMTSFVLLLLPGILRFIGLRENPTIENMALRIGSFYPNIKDKLSNALQLAPIKKQENYYSQDLALAAFHKVYNEAAELDFKVITGDESKKMKRYMLYLLFTVIFTGATFGIFQNTMGESLHRLVNFSVSFVPPAPFSIDIEPKKAEILRGDSLIISVIGTGELPETIDLYYKESIQENYDKFQIRLNTETNTYSYIVTSLKHSVSFYASADWLNSSITTEIAYVEVIDKPLVRSMAGRIMYPSYTNLNPRSFDEQNGDISALRGSNVELRAITNKDLDSAFIVILKNSIEDELNETMSEEERNAIETTRIRMNVESNSAYGSFRISSSANYYVKVYDKDGQSNENQIIYSIIALTDEYPTITLIEPESDAQLGRDAILPIRVIISDDYGFNSLRLYYKLTKSRFTYPDKDFSYIELNVNRNEIYTEVPYVWDLNSLDITPEDTYEFYLEVADNDIVSGPKTARTRTIEVRLPSMDEILRRTETAQKDIQEQLMEAAKESDDIRKEMEELNRELLQKNRTKELDWDTKKKAEDLVKRQEQLSEKFQEISENVEDMANQLQENNLMSPETMQKFMELQKLMQEVNSPELRRMQERMQEAMQQMSPEEMRKAMEQMEFNEEQFRRSIERTMKILQRLQAEQKVDAMMKRAEEMISQLEDLQKQMDNTNPNDKNAINDINKRQEKLQQDLANLQKEMASLEDLMKEIGEDEMPMDKLSDAADALNPEETNQQMEDSKKDAQQGDMNKSKQNMKKAQQNMSNFANQMQQLKQQMQQDNMEEAMRNMSKAISDMLELSKRQESLKDRTAKTDNNTTQVPEFAKDQAEILESMMNVANSMMELSEKSFAVTPEMGMEIGQALQNMQASVSQMADRRMSQAARSQMQSMAAMNRAASQMQDMLSQMQGQNEGACDNPGGSGQGQGSGGTMSFSQRMQQLAAQQQMINSAMQQQSSGQGQGQGQGQLSQEQRAEMGRISQEQGNAQKSLEELAQEQKEMGGDERKTLGDLNKIAEEMQEVIKDMQSGNITPETMKRQERILSRLLDANRSIHDRDFEQKRKGTTAEQLYRNSPDGLNLTNEEARRRAMEELLKSNRAGYSKDYELLIRRYFEALQNNN